MFAPETRRFGDRDDFEQGSHEHYFSTKFLNCAPASAANEPAERKKRAGNCKGKNAFPCQQ